MLADVLGIEDVYAGCLDGNLDCCIGVYNSKNNNQSQRICIGNIACTKTLEKNLSILIHWTDNPSQCEEQALNALDRITSTRNYAIDGFVVRFFKSNEPVYVGRDEKGICEYVIETKVYYEKRKE